MIAAVAGCASHKSPTTQPMSMYDRQDAAMRDPFGYSPDVQHETVTGGKTGEFDRNAMKKDIDHVLNP
jgi:hypothetical protein